MTQNSVETLEDFGSSPAGIAKRWIAEINLYQQQTNPWEGRADAIVAKYRADNSDPVAVQQIRRFSLLWSNIEVQKPIIYARLPKADVQRRFKDNDPVARLACEISERALDYGIQCTDRFDRVMKDCCEDYLLTAQGVSWQRYVPHFKQTAPRINVTPYGVVEQQRKELPGVAEDGVQISNDTRQIEPAQPNYQYKGDNGQTYGADQVNKDENGFYVDGQPQDVLEYEEVVDDYIYYKDWGCNAGARTWDEVYMVFRVAYMTKDELTSRFGKKVADEVPLDYEPKALDPKTAEDVRELFKKATVYEIWDRSTRKVYWINLQYHQGPLDQRDDPLGLDDFFPCPRPMWMTQTNDKLIPVPDYVFYQDQDAEIQSLTSRIGIVEGALRVRGIYPANVQAVRDVMTDAGNNDMVPIDYNVLISMQISDLSKAIFFWPIEPLTNALKAMIEMRNQLIQDVYQITGLSDVLRGQGDPDETATGQQLKAQYGGLRVREKQKEVQRFARDMLRIRFEIIFNHFDPSTIWKMTNAEAIPDVMKDPTRGQPDPQTGQMNEYGQMFTNALALLRNKAMRSFKVDIETDSTVAADENMEKQRVNELLTSIGGFMAQVGPVVESAPEFAPAMGEVMMYAFRRYRAGNTIESAMESAVEAFTQRLANPQPAAQQGPSPDAMIEAKMQQAELQQRAQESQQKTAVDMAKTQQDGQLKAEQLRNDRADLALRAIAMQRDPEPQSVQ